MKAPTEARRAELAALYPGCPNAAALQEYDYPAMMWDTILRHHQAEPSYYTAERLVSGFKAAARKAISIIPDGPVSVALPEMDHPDFLRYVKDRLKTGK